MTTLQNNALYFMCAFLVIADMLGGYFHILPPDTAVTAFIMIVGTLLGVHIPTPNKPATTP